MGVPFSVSCMLSAIVLIDKSERKEGREEKEREKEREEKRSHAVKTASINDPLKILAIIQNRGRKNRQRGDRKRRARGLDCRYYQKKLMDRKRPKLKTNPRNVDGINPRAKEQARQEIPGTLVWLEGRKGLAVKAMKINKFVLEEH